MDNDQFFKMLKDMTNDQLAERLERGGEIIAPNPHFVLEAARRLRARNEDVSRLRTLVKGLLEASSISCADCKYDCYSDHRNCIIHEAAKYIDESEVENG